jgi:hypothetical protein
VYADNAACCCHTCHIVNALIHGTISHMKRYLFIGIVLLLGFTLYYQRYTFTNYQNSREKTELPTATSYNELVILDIVDEIEINESEIPLNQPEELDHKIDEEEDMLVLRQDALNLDVPFQAQAPFAEWAMPYKEACEEASLIMIDHYIRGEILSKQKMKQEIDMQVAWQNENFGGHYDLGVADVQVLGLAFYDYTFEIIEDLTIETIREQLNLGRPIIVPAAGRELGNPNFTQPGPLYHMLIIKGYTADGYFITNDPGTRRGADFVYDPETLLGAIRDWDGTAPKGPARGLVFYK